MSEKTSENQAPAADLRLKIVLHFPPPQQRTYSTNRDLILPYLMKAADHGGSEQKENSKHR
jgi:hypothetical protein